MKPYYGLWLLLAACLIIITIISYSDEMTLLGHTFRKAPIAETLSGKGNADDDLRARLEEMRAMTDSIVEEAYCDTTAQSILIIGDSMTYDLALRLALYAKQNGHTIHAVNWDSSSTVAWANSDRLDNYIKEFKPTVVFISLGANELLLTNPDARKPEVEKILAKIGDIPHVWIGPPNWKEDSGINDMLEAVNPHGTFFRSAGMEFERKKDHIHPTRRAAALWMDSIMRWIPKSSHPFRVEAPADSLKKPKVDIIYIKAGE